MLDLDAELKIWLGSNPIPLTFEFNKNAPVNDVYRLLSEHILSPRWGFRSWRHRCADHRRHSRQMLTKRSAPSISRATSGGVTHCPPSAVRSSSVAPRATAQPFQT
jgi:hypothetical protein